MASGSGPDDVLQASEGKTRFVRLARLLLCGGTTVMRELFDYIIPPAMLATVLSNPVVKTRLTDMKTKKILTSPQWQKLYPPPGAGPVQSTHFDITLLFKLLRENTISSLSAPSKGWDELPNISDFSLPADMARIKYYRNGIAHGDEKMELIEQQFSDYWKQIRNALLRIVGRYAASGSSTVKDWETAIDRLLTDPLTEDDRKNVEELKSWYLDERELKEMVDHVRLLLESSKNDGKVFSTKFITKATTFGAWLGGNVYILHRLKDHPDLLIDYVKYGIIPTGILICCVAFGSIKLTLKAETLDALDEFWRRYETGQLKNDFEKMMITEELKNLANGDRVEVTVEVNEKEFKETRKRLEEKEASKTPVRPFCILPPKPAHEIVDRSEDISTLLQEMNRLRNEKINEITVIYLSGNPGCGKSEMARQSGQEFYVGDVTEEKSELKFVFTFDASSRDTVIQSYIEFARALGCPKDSIVTVIKTEDPSCVLKLPQLKSLISPKLEKYSSWLMIVENVKDLELVSRYFPPRGEKTSGKGQLLVTTNDSQSLVLDSHAYHLSLSAGMKPDDAVKMLTCISTCFTEKEMVLKVAKELDFQPLAMACAASWMRFARTTEYSMTWTRLLEQMNSAEYEETEKADIKGIIAYPAKMRAIVLMAVRKEMSDDVRMHAFYFLSLLAAKPVPLKYLINYVANCIPEKEEESVAASVSTCSFLVKETGMHEVVHDCLLTLISNSNAKKENEIAVLMKVVETFLSLRLYLDIQSSDFILETGTLVVHFVALAEGIKQCIENCSRTELMSTFDNKYAIMSTESLLMIGDVCLTHGKHDAARICFEMSLMIQETFYSEHYPPLASTLNRLGKALSGLNNFEEAKKCFEKALTIEEMMVFSKEHPSLSTTLNNMGTIFRDLGLAEDARKYFQRALEVEQMTYGKEHPSLAKTLNNIGTTFLDLGLANEALTHFERALTLAGGESGEKEVKLIKAHTLINLGDSFSGLGDYKNSKSCFEEALNIYEMIYNECHPTVAVTLNKLGNILRDLGEPQQAKECLERVLSIDEQVYPGGHPLCAATFNNLGNICRDLEQYSEAITCFEQALSILDENHPSSSSVLCNLSLVFRDLGHLREAKGCLERSLTIQKTHYGKNHSNLIAIFTNLGLTLSDMGQLNDSKKYFWRATAISKTVYGKMHPLLVVALKNLAFILDKLEQYDDAALW